MKVIWRLHQWWLARRWRRGQGAKGTAAEARGARALYLAKIQQRATPDDPWRDITSPFDAEVIKEGDPGWEVVQKVIETGKPVVGTYDGATGKITSMEVWDPESEEG